jgi:C4-dicarboxylate transporter DctM subunit
MNLSIGFITPPYGANLFIASAVGKTPMDRIIKHVWPLIGAIIAVLLLTTFIPALSMIFV